MAPDSLNLLYYGSPEPLPARQKLYAGPLTVTYQQGELLHVRWRGREILHRMYAAVRDRNWGTVPFRVSNLRVDQCQESFHIAFEARHQQDEIHFRWNGSIEGHSKGQLVFALDGEALSTFLRSRIGFCLLHSTDLCAGKPFQVIQPNSVKSCGVFPETIAREQTISGTEAMATLAWEAYPGLRTKIAFAGDVFQMEDQRNWTDATFKTFCTPLELPYPVEIRQGTRISQKVTISLEEAAVAPAIVRGEEPIDISVRRGETSPMPAVGLGTASHGEPLAPEEIKLLHALRPSHLRVDLRLSGPDWQAALKRAILQARQLGCKLEMVAFVSDNAAAQLEQLSSVVSREEPAVSRWLIFHEDEPATAERWLSLAKGILTGCVGGGTNANFYELTNFRPAEPPDFVAFAIQAQEHAFDHASVMETLPIQAHVLQAAAGIYSGVPIAISPVTLKPRFNPNATGPEKPSAPGELPPQVDVRQNSLFGAVWTLGSLKYLAEGGAQSITYFETTGWRGVMERKSGSPLPECFPSHPGRVFPLYHVLADACDFAGGQVLRTRCSAPNRVATLAMSQGYRIRLLAANLTPETIRVSLRGIPSTLRVTVLDESTVQSATRHPRTFRTSQPLTSVGSGDRLVLGLRPYSVLRADTVGSPR